MSYSLSAAFGITLRTTDSKNVHRSPIPTEEASIVIAISINPANESFRCSQGKLHSVLATRLAHWNVKNIDPRVTTTKYKKNEGVVKAHRSSQNDIDKISLKYYIYSAFKLVKANIFPRTIHFQEPSQPDCFSVINSIN